MDRKAFASASLAVESKSIQQVNAKNNLFDTYYDSLIRAPIDISKNNIEPKGKGARFEYK